MTTVTQQAELILSKPENEGWDWRTHEDVLIIDAVNFGEDVAQLAGAFDNKYGLAYIIYDEKAKSFTDIMKIHKENICNDIVYMPHSLSTKLKTIYGTTIGYWTTKQPYNLISDIDYKLLSEQERVGYESNPDVRCDLFTTTLKGRAEFLSHATDEEVLEWKARIEIEIAKAEQTFKSEIACAERPYLVLVQGTDDCSYARTFDTADHAFTCLKDLHSYGFTAIHTQMNYTN